MINNSVLKLSVKSGKNGTEIDQEIYDIIVKALEEDDLDVIKEYVPSRVPIDYIFSEYIIFL